MKTIYKILCTFILLQIVFTLSSEEKVSANVCGNQVLYDYFSKFGSTFIEGGEIATKDVYTGRTVGVNCTYLNRGYLFFGNSNDANKMNTARGGIFGTNKFYAHANVNRFIGITYHGRFVFASNVITEDFTTSGETGKRDYLNWRGGGISNSVKPNTENPWNEYSSIADAFTDRKANKAMTVGEAEELYKQWTENYVDHYANVARYRAVNGAAFTRTETTDLFKPMDFAKKRMLAHIITPPTEKTYGRFVEWHNSRGIGHLYDVFNIAKTNANENNFVATDLVVTPVGNSYSVQFKVKFTGKKKVELKFAAKDIFKVSFNGRQIHTEETSSFPLVWEPGQEYVVDMGMIDIGGELQEGDELLFYAHFNHDEAIEEDTYVDNFIWKTIKGKGPEVCKFGGFGEQKKYENMYCASYSTNSEGVSVCTEYKCRVSTYSLAYTIDTLSDPKRQTLMGVWSGNYYGHKELSVPNAKESKPSQEEWNKPITSHNVPGIEQDKLKRVIRAGKTENNELPLHISDSVKKRDLYAGNS